MKQGKEHVEMQQATQRIPYSVTGLNPYPWIRWWYAIAAPPTPPNAESLPLREREFLRRGKLTCIAMLIEVLLLLIALGPIGVNPQQQGILVGSLIALPLVFIAVAVFLNRAGKLLLAGFLVVISLEAVQFAMTLILQPNGLTITELTLLFLFVQPLMLSVLLFPPWAILVTAGVNVVLTILLVFSPLFPKAPDLAAFFHAQPGIDLAVFMVPTLTQLVCAFISFIVITSLQESLKRADKAEEVTKLHEILAEQARQELQTKRQLEGEVQEVIAGLTRFASGDTQARIQLGMGSMLWSVAGSVNTMMGRFVRLREHEQPMEQTYMALKAYLAAVRTARARGVAGSYPRCATSV
jgi:hypothetical protein